jgi:hypothetical protein
MPGKPLPASGTGLPGGVNIQNRPASSVIKWPDTFNSVVGRGPGAEPDAAPAGATGAGWVLVWLTADYLAPEFARKRPPEWPWNGIPGIRTGDAIYAPEIPARV